MIYLYGIVECGAAPPECAGMDEAPLELLDLGEVAVLISRHAERAVSAEPASLWRHDLVLERAMALGPVLPIRFGTTFSDEDAVAAALADQAEPLREQLEEVRGCVELAVRVALPERPPSSPPSGRDYVEERLALERELAGVAQAALEPLEPLALRSRRRGRSGAQPLLTASYLVRASDVERFAEEVGRVEQASPGLRLSCTGPWAPYSFVEPEAA